MLLLEDLGLRICCKIYSAKEYQIINCDRGIGFGLGSSSNDGGIIRNNMIYNDGHHTYNDVGIGLETSPNTKVYNNTVIVDYPNAIEYRFEETENVEILNNIVNKNIRSRNGGQAEVRNNIYKVSEDWFVDLESGDLRLVEANDVIVDSGENLLGEVDLDIDKNERPQNGVYDIGAHEFPSISTDTKELTEQLALEIYPNPSAEYIILRSKENKQATIEIWRSDQKQVYHKTDHLLTEYLNINTDLWEQGVYFVKIITDRHLSVKTFVKQ
jgi:hypothetical protein